MQSHRPLKLYIPGGNRKTIKVLRYNDRNILLGCKDSNFTIYYIGK